MRSKTTCKNCGKPRWKGCGNDYRCVWRRPLWRQSRTRSTRPDPFRQQRVDHAHRPLTRVIAPRPSRLAKERVTAAPWECPSDR